MLANGFYRWAPNRTREYVLADGVSAVRFDRDRTIACLASWRGPLLLLGDSRLRFLYAAVAGLMGARTGAGEQPAYAACPYSNVAGVHTKECAHYYFPHDDEKQSATLCYNYSARGALVMYCPVKYAHEGIQRAASRLRDGTWDGRRVGALFANFGAWSHMVSRGWKAPHRVDTAENTDAYVAQLTRLLPGVPKVWVGYPVAALSGVFSQAERDSSNVSRLRPSWAVYNAMPITSGFCNASHVHTQYVRAWHRTLVPFHTLRALAKWDQCDGLHTFDALTDLEVQVLLNGICIPDGLRLVGSSYHRSWARSSSGS